MKVFAALAAAFSREQVESCFALLGDANMHWAGALADLGVKCGYGDLRTGFNTNHDDPTHCSKGTYTVNCFRRGSATE